ncbi:MAG: hypothetical protein QW112_00110 [Candidatus Micrarchaeia archaeon]
MKRSRGRMAKKTRMVGRKVRKHKVTPAEMVKNFPIGSSVQIVPRGNFEDFPHMRYAGRVGKIAARRGNCYIIEVRDGNLVKKLIASPVHIRKI